MSQYLLSDTHFITVTVIISLYKKQISKTNYAHWRTNVFSHTHSNIGLIYISIHLSTTLFVDFKVEGEAAAYMDDESKFELREQKIRLDKEFGEMLGKIGNRKEMLTDLESKLSAIDRARQTKEEELRMLERKLVVLLEEQQNELDAIRRKQTLHSNSNDNNGSRTSNSTALVTVGENRNAGGSGPSLQEKRQAAQLMESTETLMKFGFMSMSMTYFSSLNMIKALRTVSAQDTVMAALADVQAQRASGNVPGGKGKEYSIVYFNYLVNK